MNSDTMKGQWKQLLGRAKKNWSKITDDELLRIEGNVQQLSGLIQERYGIARDEADRQIQKFADSVDSKTDSERTARKRPESAQHL